LHEKVDGEQRKCVLLREAFFQDDGDRLMTMHPKDSTRICLDYSQLSLAPTLIMERREITKRTPRAVRQLLEDDRIYPGRIYFTDNDCHIEFASRNECIDAHTFYRRNTINHAYVKPVRIYLLYSNILFKKNCRG